MSRARRSPGWGLVLLTAVNLACNRPPAVQYHNLQLLSSLRTAISAKHREWLEGVARAVEIRHEQGTMSAEERDHFLRIVELARTGAWDTAEREAFRFEEAQLSRSRPPLRASESPHAD